MEDTTFRIRASCLAEAVQAGEVSLTHRSGTVLWADALTKGLPTQSLERFRPSVVKEVKTLAAGESVKLSRCIAAMLTGASLLPQGEASEVCEKVEFPTTQTSSFAGDLGWLVFLAGLVCLLHFIKDVGLVIVKRLMSGKEEVKVKLLNDEAIVPTRGSDGAAGWDLSTTMQCRVAPQ